MLIWFTVASVLGVITASNWSYSLWCTCGLKRHLLRCSVNLRSCVASSSLVECRKYLECLTRRGEWWRNLLKKAEKGDSFLFFKCDPLQPPERPSKLWRAGKCLLLCHGGLFVSLHTNPGCSVFTTFNKSSLCFNHIRLTYEGVTVTAAWDARVTD